MSHLVDKILSSFDINGTRQAFCFENIYYTYFDFSKKVFGMIDQFKRLKNKLPANPNIGVFANNNIETYASLIACWVMGVTYVSYPSFTSC